MMRRVVLALVVASSLFGARHASAQDAEAVAAYRKAREEIVPRFRALAAWCEGERLIQDRDRACETILAIAPDDPAARRTLHYVRGKDGKWARGYVPKTSPTDPARAPDVAAKRAEALAPYRASVLALVGVREAPPAVRENALDELIRLDPDDAETRAANRETRVGDKWLLDETVAAGARRAQLLSSIESTRKTPPAPEVGAPDAFETGVAPRWADVQVGAFARVADAPGTHEAAQTTGIFQIVHDVYGDVLGAAPPVVPRVRIMFFPDGPAALSAMGRDSRIRPEELASARALYAWWVPNTTDFYSWASSGAERTEWALRFGVGIYMCRQFGVWTKSGWVVEGFGHWFSEAVLGSHKCFWIRPSEYANQKASANDLRKRLVDGPADWLGEGRTLEMNGAWPDLRVALSRDVSAMTTEDALVAYVLARYLVDGRRPGVPDLLRAVGRGESPDAWTGAVFGSTVEGLDVRVRRWLRETR